MTNLAKWTLVRVLFTSLYLFGGWLLFTWSLDARSLILGAGFSLTIALATFRIFIDDDEAARRSLMPRVHLLVFYLLLVLYKIYLASFAVAWSTLRGDFNPRVVHFRTRLNHLVVHWLNAETTHSRFAGELIKGGFERLLRKIWV
jgi:multicomponent Na+:H+ antiporter subunit E